MWSWGGLALWGLVAVIAIVVLFVLLARAGDVPDGPALANHAERRRRLLAERHRRGELTTEEYEERLRNIR